MRTTMTALNFLLSICLLSSLGCSSLGLSLFPTGHYLTDQSEQILKQAPKSAMIPRELNRTVMPVHYLEPGDVLLLEPVKLDSEVRLPADQRVLVDGSIDLGKFGRAVVAGMTLEEAENFVGNTIAGAGEKDAQFNIRLLESVHRFYVLGEVNSPGSYPLTGYETVLDGILAAGGLTSDAATCKILLARPTDNCSCRVTLPVCYREITQMGDATTNFQLQPGDRIFVSSRSFCEELMFWRASQTCAHCSKCQKQCPHPESIQGVVPIRPSSGVNLFSSAFPFSILKPATTNPQDINNSVTDGLNEGDKGPVELAQPSPFVPGNQEEAVDNSAPPIPPEFKGIDPSPKTGSPPTTSQELSQPRIRDGSLDGQLDFAEPIQIPERELGE